MKTIATQEPTKPKRTRKAPPVNAVLPSTGFVRLSQVLTFVPVGKSTFWMRVKSGDYPQPIKLGPRTTVWRAEAIRDLIERIAKNA